MKVGVHCVDLLPETRATLQVLASATHCKFHRPSKFLWRGPKKKSKAPIPELREKMTNAAK